MDNIEIITSELLAGNISVQEVQRRLSVYLYSEGSKAEQVVSPNQIDSAIHALDNELELVIFTTKKENQAETVLVILDKARQLVFSGFAL